MIGIFHDLAQLESVQDEPRRQDYETLELVHVMVPVQSIKVDKDNT